VSELREIIPALRIANEFVSRNRLMKEMGKIATRNFTAAPMKRRIAKRLEHAGHNE